MMIPFHPVHGPWGPHVAATPVFLVNQLITACPELLAEVVTTVFLISGT